MSSTADSRRGAPARVRLPLTAGETPSAEAPHERVRAPRPWTASLQRPAAKILVAGGLTLAGWLLGAALSGSTASAAAGPACPEAPVVSTVDHAADHAAKPFWHARHRKHHHETGAATCALQPKIDSAGPPADETQQNSAPTTASGTTSETTKDSAPTEEPTTTSSDSAPTEEPALTKSASPDSEPAQEPAPTKATSSDNKPAEAPKATSAGGNLLGGLVGNTLGAVTGATTKDTAAAPAFTTKATGGDLLGGLVGGVLDVVGGTLSTVTGTVGALTDTLSHTVLAPLTQPSANYPGATVLLPLDDVLGPVFSGGSNAGGVTATVPGGPAVVTEVPAATVAETVPAGVTEAEPQQTTRVAVVHLVVRQSQTSLPVVQDQPRDSGTHATGGGGDSTPGLPGGTTAPSAPAPTAAPGHDGPGGARHAFAVHTDDVTTTQLKLIGTSRDHEVDGAGREAALPTTSPD
ncbi:hypothetical protein Q5425_18740 [Amycolatopsis sp. A133]|uniref:hypothetical protein n=1 Tax=Amycolatopsis sp. A133 TaxID=3064472 RepID=UPI0027ED4D6F|nr:hypothetical protein [Amycolatopsis sp. A133]MDQ7805788.1 hypothetical protein [Amycolatopsis sp. A133]